jgi:hypothetical protein
MDRACSMHWDMENALILPTKILKGKYYRHMGDLVVYERIIIQ